MNDIRARLAGWALIVGAVVASAGYLAANALASGAGDTRFTSPHWSLLNGIAIGGDIIVVLGLPAILAGHGRRAEKLTIFGYIGIFAALVMLNISEGVIEAFVKPYLVGHGGIPSDPPAGYAVYETFALVLTLAGFICMGIAVLRAKVYPWWTGVLLIVTPVVSFLGLPGGWALIADYLCFAALLTIGVLTVRGSARTALDPQLRVRAEQQA
ncbi:hypothetical protein [Microtetraspora malaysiensis]|uniref:hypothetical protein n=1 Tax=Microtetraspora malaysiensis TaxID=161358 RepID=UPI000831084D|nr:hypothetical protein [Microtetraspora malaysiensis]